MQAREAAGRPVAGVRHTVTMDPADFAAGLRPVAAGVRAGQGPGKHFRADVYAAPLQKLGLFTVRIRDAHVERGSQAYAAITVPVSGPLEFFRRGKGELFHPSSAHILHTRDALDLRIGAASGLFVATFDQKWIDGTTWRLTQHQHYYDLHHEWRLDLESSTGMSFRHFLDFIWAETCHGGHFTRSELAVREIENTCTTLLILASEAGSRRQLTRADQSKVKRPIEMAEEYLRANLTEPYALDKLIEITGASASTLSREFRRRHGMPPFQFLKLRRLEAARRELLTAEPDEATVTEIATAYGFYHLGRFAGRYKEVFGELPSETLRRPRRVESNSYSKCP